MSESDQALDYQMLESYIILLLGIVNRPIKSIIHLQKEMFILSRTAKYVNDVTYFVKHQLGPFSSDISEVIDFPVYHSQPFQRIKGKISLSKNGEKIYKNLLSDYSQNDKFKELLASMKLIREIYDRLTREELLFLVYITYPTFEEKSDVSEELLKPDKRKIIAGSLLKKRIITEKRYNEVIKNQ